MRLRVKKTSEGAFAITLDHPSAAVLMSLPVRLRDVLGRKGAGGRLLGRLFPPAYADPTREAEYRHLLGEDLVRRKLECVEAFEKTLKNLKPGLNSVTVRIPPEQFELWLGFVNDMRLVLGIELEITEDGWEMQMNFDPADPRSGDIVLLHWLGWLEDELLRAHG